MKNKSFINTKFDKNIFGWIMYDFANSSFTTIIVTVVYSMYFKNVVVGEGELGTLLWGRSIAISMLLVGISAPIFGAVADFSRAKKRFLFYSTYLTIIFTALLFFVRSGDIKMGMTFFIIANFGYNIANVFYNALLPDISSPEGLGKVSGLGWSVGYIGGMLSLLLIMPFIKNGLIEWVFPSVALFFAIFSVFTFILLKEVNLPSKRTNYFKTAFRRIKTSAQNVRKFKDLMKYIISYLIYNDGIVVVISFTSIYGASQFGMTAKQLITYFIIMQPTSIIGAFVFGYFVNWIGGKNTISLSLILWIFVILGAYFSQNIQHYYIVGLLAGLAIGSSQSASRTMLALLTPKSKTAEFFGFYSFTGRMASIIGPLVYGEISKRTGDQRNAIFAIILFFVIGGIILQFVNEKKGIKEASNWIE